MRTTYRAGVVQRVTPIGAQQVAADLAVGVVAVVTVLAITSQIEQSGNDRALDAKAYACMVVAGAVLACKRRWPVATVAAVTAALSFYLARGYPGGPVFVTLFVSLYALARTRRRRVSFAAAAAAAGALVLVGEVAGTGPGLVHLVFVGWAGAAVFLGDAVQSHRDTVDALEERARHLEESRHQDARRQVAEERLRIAQDLHDSVAHSMAVISVQSGVAAHVVDRYPDRAREAMLVVKQSSGEVLDELGALLGLLRLDGEIAAPVAPTPGPERLADLVESARRSGVEVDLRIEGDIEVISRSVGVALYRIAQESLTNVARHGGPGTAATVTVAANPDGLLRLEVVDDGAGPGGATTGTGVGIVGMRERAEASGGTLEAECRPDRGFVVRAVWPSR